MDLNKELVNEIIAISKKYDSIYKVVLFGSRAREDNDLKSDIDLAYIVIVIYLNLLKR